MNVPDNRIDTVWRHYRQRLAQTFSEGEATTQVSWLFQDLFAMPRSHVMMHPDQALSESELLKIHFAVERLEQGEPLQYVTGQAEFMGRSFKVDSNVLIPRPETEELVQWIGEEQARPQVRALDIGTGSGIIPISLKLNHPDWELTGLDVSAGALAVAKENANHLGADVTWMESDVLKNDPPSHFDIVISNPPYVLDSEADEMQEQVVKHEPGLALFVPDQNPLLFYERILHWGRENMASGSVVYFEIHERYGREIIAIFDSCGFVNVTLRKDLNGKDRMIRGYRP